VAGCSPILSKKILSASPRHIDPKFRSLASALATDLFNNIGPEPRCPGALPDDFAIRDHAA
jgi:hypothetical protein